MKTQHFANIWKACLVFFALSNYAAVINFNSSFGLSTIYYWTRKIIHKMIGTKERLGITNFVDHSI